MSGIMADPKQPQIENRLREKRLALGLSQKQLAAMAGITRQAICAVEANQYSPATSVSLQLARALRCRVEELFSIRSGNEIIEGELWGALPQGAERIRAQVIQFGDRLLVRPLDGYGELTSLSATADGLILGSPSKHKRVKVMLLKDREVVRRKIVVAGCDPAMFLASEYLAGGSNESVVPYLMGNSMALMALARGEAHVAGVHLADERSGSWNLPDLERTLKGTQCLVITFAHWEEGLIVKRGNPKSIRTAADLARSAVRFVNREIGSGARRLLDRELKSAGIQATRVKGYRDELSSHLEVAARVKAGLADVGIGVRAAASICGLDFVPLQRERYDLVIPSSHYESLPGVQKLLDTIVSKSFRDELGALGYDTRETGKRVEMNQRRN
jgi:molybdate-binding protein/DNA-binding XRE family transcriptional regulator